MPSAPARPVPRGRLLTGAAAALAALGAAIYAVDSDLVGLFLPVRSVVLALLVGSAGLLGVRLRWHRSATGIALLVVGIGLGGWVYAHEFRAYRELDLSFENAGARLAGTLYLPDAPGPHPALVIAQGSIRAPRRLYHHWADRLAREGIAVYSFDKRGTGASGGDYEGENNSSVQNLALLAADVAAAITAVRRHPEVDAERVGVFGVSMGGWTGPLAAHQLDAAGHPPPAFMVINSGPAVSVGEERFYSDLTGEGHREGAGRSPAEVDSLVAARAPSGYDPRAVLGALDVPTLWVFGADDPSVPVAKSLAVLDSLRTRHGRPYRALVLPEAVHLGFVMRWPFDLAPGFWPPIVAWVRQPR